MSLNLRQKSKFKKDLNFFRSRLHFVRCCEPKPALPAIRWSVTSRSMAWSPRTRGPLGWLTHQDDSKTSSRHRDSARVALRERPGSTRYSIPLVGLRSSGRSPRALGPVVHRGGGDEETRTPDPLLAKEMLFRLSYVPLPPAIIRTVRGGRFWTRTRDLCLIRAVL